MSHDDIETAAVPCGDFLRVQCPWCGNFQAFKMPPPGVVSGRICGWCSQVINLIPPPEQRTPAPPGYRKTAGGLLTPDHMG